eukprot:6417333-Prymnesium_polylepis.1
MTRRANATPATNRHGRPSRGGRCPRGTRRGWAVDPLRRARPSVGGCGRLAEQVLVVVGARRVHRKQRAQPLGGARREGGLSGLQRLAD